MYVCMYVSHASEATYSLHEDRQTDDDWRDAARALLRAQQMNDEWMDVLMYGLDGLMEGLMDGWMDGWMDWMD